MKDLVPEIKRKYGNHGQLDAYSSSMKHLRIGDKSYFVFEFPFKEVIANFKAEKISTPLEEGSCDLASLLNNVQAVFAALFEEGFLTNGCKLTFGPEEQSILEVKICV